MNKDTIEIFRDINHIQGYSTFGGVPQITEQEQLNKIIEWSQNKLGAKVYKHFVRSEEILSNKVYKYFSNGGEITKQRYEELQIVNLSKQTIYTANYGTMVYYLDIYYQ